MVVAGITECRLLLQLCVLEANDAVAQLKCGMQNVKWRRPHYSMGYQSLLLQPVVNVFVAVTASQVEILVQIIVIVVIPMVHAVGRCVQASFVGQDWS